MTQREPSDDAPPETPQDLAEVAWARQLVERIKYLPIDQGITALLRELAALRAAQPPSDVAPGDGERGVERRDEDPPLS